MDTLTARRSFLSTLILGLVAAPALLRAALKPSPATGSGLPLAKLIEARDLLDDGIITEYRGFEFIRTRMPLRYRVMESFEPPYAMVFYASGKIAGEDYEFHQTWDISDVRERGLKKLYKQFRGAARQAFKRKEREAYPLQQVVGDF